MPVSGMSKLGRVGGPFGMGTSFPSFSVRMATAVLKLMAAFVFGMGAPALVELIHWADLFIAGFSCKSNSVQPLGELWVRLCVYMLPEAIIILPD